MQSLSYMRYIILMTLGVFITSTLHSQTDSSLYANHGKAGFRASGFGSSVTIELPCWISPNATLAPTFSLRSIQRSGTELSLGVSFRQYIGDNQVKPFAGLAADIEYMRQYVSSSSTSTARTVLSPGASLIGGADYFVTPRFSVGVQAQLSFRVIDHNSQLSTESTRNVFSTGSALAVGVYF